MTGFIANNLYYMLYRLLQIIALTMLLISLNINTLSAQKLQLAHYTHHRQLHHHIPELLKGQYWNDYMEQAKKT
ncbi:MAG: hypothetical protein AAF403_05300, partial [Pseudomonadota bacterium]